MGAECGCSAYPAWREVAAPLPHIALPASWVPGCGRSGCAMSRDPAVSLPAPQSAFGEEVHVSTAYTKTADSLS